MTRNFQSAIVCLLMIIGLSMICDSASAQWRGRYVRRSGLLHDVERYHWGGGITPTGAGVLSTGIMQFAPVVAGLVGREAPADGDDASRTRDLARSVLGDAYAEQQRRANVLLEQTAALVNFSAATQPPVIGGDTSTNGTGDPAGPEFGPRPWRARPQ